MSSSLQNIALSFNVSEADARRAIRETLDSLGPQERRTEPYCDYVYVFEDKPERLVIKQYLKGVLMIQGKAGSLHQTIMVLISPLLGLQPAPGDAADLPAESPDNIPLPYIGSDESGKGDYFGPLVIAGVMVESDTLPALLGLGIRDSKQLSDARCRELAVQIRRISLRRYYEVVIPPERYNTLYTDFTREGKNLNHLLAWGHARVIENLLAANNCALAVADQFGDERYILSRLMARGRKVRLIQRHRGERYPAVAAASILARDRFLEYMDRLSHVCGITLPRGAANGVVEVGQKIVEQRGADALGLVAKLHHRTTQKIIAP